MRGATLRSTLKPNTVLNLAFGKQRTIKLKSVTDSQINIPELRADKVLLIEFTAFLPLFHKRRDPRTIKVQRKLLAQVSDPKLREGLTAATLLVDIKVFGMEIVEAEFTKKELNMLKKTGFVQGWLNDSETKGRREGKLSVVEILLNQKLGGLSPRLRGQLQKLDGKKLDRLTLNLQRISNRSDLQAWLKNGTDGASRHASR